ncbi:2-dehydropantoate 2-reductase N-terminal domain-containing protein [Streptomyces sp. NPDC001250]|uniref:2-dehydropantoate 2-reductase N-terminal domain-containing protein n=1 Tax=unclassified Streptomyces TaxID=2593676 RepID=UPI0033318543
MKVAVLGAGAIGAYVGAALHRAGADVHLVARATNEMNYVAQKFARVGMGTNNVDSCNRTCRAPSLAGLSAAFGSDGGTSSYAAVGCMRSIRDGRPPPRGPRAGSG